MALTFIFVAVGLSCLLIIGLIITQRLDTFERDLAGANVRRARNSLQQDMVRIDNLVKDWAWWDDTYGFMATLSGDYIDSNITPEVFRNQELSVIAFVSAHGEILHASYMPRDGDKLEPPREALLNHIRKTGLSYPPGDLFSGRPEVINVGGSLWMAASRTVLTSQQTGPVRGRLWMIQEIDDAYIKKLTQRTELALRIHVSDAPELPKAMAALRAGEVANEALVVSEGSTIWSGLLLPDSAGGKPIAIVASAPREVAAMSKTILKTTLAFVLVLGFAGFFSSIGFLEKRILSRLSDLSARVRRDAPDAQLCRIGQDCDEIDQLSNLVDSAFTSIRENERFLQESEKRYRAIFMNTGTPGILINEDTSLAVANTEFLHLARITEEDMLRAPSWTHFFHPDDAQRMLRYHALRRQDENSAPRTYEARLIDASGEIHHVRLTVAVIPNSQQSIAFLLDISDIKNAERKLHELAYTDALTGLPNRLRAMERLERTVQSLSPETGSLAVFLLDLDDFKVINDSWGHAVGDVILMEAGQRLVSVLKHPELVGRLGGDEFIIVSDFNRSRDEYEQLAQKLIHTLAAPFQFGDSETHLSVSVGVAFYPGDGTTAGQLVRCADLAMYQSKSLGKNIYRFHSPELTLKAQRRMEIERELRQALDSGEIIAFFQPVIDLDSGRIVGAEALARWRKPDGSLVSPVDFIPVAEQTNLIKDIDLSILSQACLHVRKWDEHGLGKLRISCNVSARHFQRGDLPQEVRGILEASRLPAGQLTLEVTETVYMENIDQVRATLDAIDRLGVSIALDDFGTGYSSLSYVHTLSFDILKIDRSFVKNLPDRSAQALIRAMLGIAASLDITPLAEGIETQEQCLLLKSLGCGLGQGYLFSPPVPAERFAELLKSENRDEAAIG